MPANWSSTAASIAALALVLSGCNTLLGVERLKGGRDAGITQTREFAALAADSGEANQPADADAPENDFDSAAVSD